MDLEYDLNTSLFRRKPPGHRGEPYDVPRPLSCDVGSLSPSGNHGTSPGGKTSKIVRRSSSPGGGSGLNGIKWETPLLGRRVSHVRSPMVSTRRGVVMCPLVRKPIVADDGTEPPPRKPRRRYLFVHTRVQSRCSVVNLILSCSVLTALVVWKPCVLLIPIERACVGTTLICPIYLYFISWLSVSSAPRISHLSYIYLTAEPAHMGVSVTAWTTGTSTCACVCLSVCKVV